MNLAPLIEHTLLKPDATAADVSACIAQAVEHQFVGICIPPYYVTQAKKELGKNPQRIVTVVGFPLGFPVYSAKVDEVKKALHEGAHEIDMVINIAALKNGDYRTVQNEIDSVTTLVHFSSKKVKVIIETGLLTLDEIREICHICAQRGVDFVKTSTGFSGQGADAGVIAKMRLWLPSKIGIKASGGIRTREQALAMVEAGATRIGTSNGMALLA